jgi:curved DNA-binding protein CbpA
MDVLARFGIMIMAVTFKDYYQVLGAPRTAAEDEIKRAYR